MQTYRRSEISKLARRPDLSGLNFDGDTIHLKHAYLKDAVLKEGSFRGTDLSQAMLVDADLACSDFASTATVLDSASLSGADLSWSLLRGTSVRGTKFEGATLRHADLADAALPAASLRGADLSEANLKGADLHGASLQDADLAATNFDSANLTNADLTDATLRAGMRPDDPRERSAQFRGTNLKDVIFEPRNIPEIRLIASARNLETLQYKGSPAAMIELRNALREAGYRDQERNVTYALMTIRTENLVLQRDASGNVSRLSLTHVRAHFERVVFIALVDWTCGYGKKLFRPLGLLMKLWFLCAVAYFFSIVAQRQPGIYRQDVPAATTSVPRALGYALLFSLMSTFNYGFRDLDFGRWLRNLVPEGFVLDARGWARALAGFQAIASLYLIVLFLFIYFGRPFDTLM